MENEIQQNVSPIQPLPQTPPVAPSSTNWSKILLFTVLGLVIVAGSVFIGIQIGKNQTISQQPIVAQPTSFPTQTAVNPTVLPTIDPTTDWKTYTNTHYLYSLKYPKEWLVKSFGPGLSELQPLNTTSRGVILSSNNQDTTVPNPMFEIQAEGPENLSRPIYSEWEKQVKVSFSEGYTLTKESTSTISGITATVLEGEHVYPKTSTYIKQFIFASSEKGVYFTITIVSDTKQESLVFDQIIPTFKLNN